MKKTAWLVVFLVVVGQSAFVADAEQQTRGGRHKPMLPSVPGTGAPNVVGTVQYDTGFNAGFHPDVGLRIVGNRFNSALGGQLLMTGMVSMVTLWPQNAGGQYVSFLTPPNGTTAMVIDFFLVTLTANQFNTVTLSAQVPVGPDFFGMFMGFFGGTPSGLLAMDDMQNLNQGFHAWQGTYTSNLTVVNMQAVPNRNALFRSTGDILVPVELMDFKVQH